MNQSEIASDFNKLVEMLLRSEMYTAEDIWYELDLGSYATAFYELGWLRDRVEGDDDDEE